jgi:glycosyltransferase involved in cell wall biosynthesis
MDKLPLVSVIIPTYNRIRKVGNAIESALKQTYPNIEIIVVDDGSEDDTPTLMKKFPGVQYIIQEHAGQAAARNNGLRRAKGTYIASLDSDDTWNPTFVEDCVECLENNNLDFVFTNWQHDDGNGEFVDPFSTYKFFRPYLVDRDQPWNILEDEELRSLYISGCPSPSSSLLIRRTSIVSEWNAHLKIADDWCVLLDIIFAKKCRAAYSKKKLWVKNQDGTNIHDGRHENELLQHLYVHDMEIMYNRHKKGLKKNEIQVYKESVTYYLTMYALQRLTIYKDPKTFVAPMRKAFMTNPKQVVSLLWWEFKARSQKKLARLIQPSTATSVKPDTTNNASSV